jgi:hypothetical protein
MSRATLVTICVLPVLTLAAYIYLEDRAAREIDAGIGVADAAAFAQAEARCQPANSLYTPEKCDQRLNQAVLRYAADKGKPPQSFRDLIDAGYLHPGLYLDPPARPAAVHTESASTPSS